MVLETRRWSEDGDEVVTIMNSKGKLLCEFSGVCPHFGGPLSFDSSTKQFRCSWHDWLFDIEGNCLNRKVSSKVSILKAFRHV